MPIKPSKNKFNSFFLIKEQNKTLHGSELIGGQWVDIALKDTPKLNVLSRAVLLIPDNKTVFRQQKFSTDLLLKKDLQEAIELDIDSWSPYETNSPRFSITQKKKDQWTIATWVWQKNTEDQLALQLPKQQLTHIMPEIAWHCARVTNGIPTLLVTQIDQQLTYAYLDKEGVPQHIASPKNDAEGSRFWRSLGEKSSAIKTVTQAYPITIPFFGLSQDLKRLDLTTAKPRSNWLKQAQHKGFNDWFNPSNWLAPALAIFSLFIIWLSVDAFLIYKKNQEISEIISQSKQNYQKVIAQQEAIEQSRTILSHYAHLRQKQQQIEQILADLSTRIPNDIWLESIHLDQQWLDIKGRGKDVIRLMTLLETLQNAEDIVLLNDVRTDRRTQDEQFQIRLILSELSQ